MTFFLPFDVAVLGTLAAHQSYGWVLVAIGVSELGRATIVALMTVGITLYLLLKRHFAYAQGLLLTVATSGIATLLLKGLIARPRPPEQYQAYHEVWYAFPSAHAALAVALYGFLAVITYRSCSSRATRLFALGGLFSLMLLIGFSRLYLGVHYLSDVLGGYLLGTLCVWLGTWTTRALERGSISS